MLHLILETKRLNKKMINAVERWKKEQGIKFLRKAGIKPGYNVLDFGARNGNYAILASKIVGKKGLVYALDKNKKELDELIKKAEAEGLENIRRIDTSGELKIPLSGQTTDVVLLYDVIHLLGKNDSSTAKDREKLYKEIRRVTKDNAIISIYPSHLTTHTDINLIEDVERELMLYFQFKKRFSTNLIHDDNIEKGTVLIFRKKDKAY